MSPVFRTLIFTILVPGFWTLVMPYWLLMAAGIALYVRCAFWGLRVARPRDAAALGSPEETGCGGALPVGAESMYWSVGSVLLGEAGIFQSLALLELAVGFAVGVNVSVPLCEEPALRRKFGAEYEEYCRRAPRWLPRLKAK